MTISTFPTNLLGIKFDRVKRPVFSSRVLTARSGKEQRAANWPFPKWQFELQYEFLRENVNSEYQTLVGFVANQLGQLNPFYYQDPYDNTVTGQTIGIGDGVTQTFRLVRTLGGFIDRIYNAPTLNHVYDNGSVVSSGVAASASGNYGNDSVTFTVAPVAGHTISADFTFNYVCRFMSDQYDYNQMWLNFWEQKKLDFTTVF